MRNLPGQEAIWRNQEHVGDQNRPIIRATITRPQMKLYTYGLRSLGLNNKSVTLQKTDTVSMDALKNDPQALFQGDNVTETYASHWFHYEFQPLELPNIKSCSWSRSIDQDAAEMTMVMTNARPVEDGTDLGPGRPLQTSVGGQLLTYPDSTYDMDQLGYYSPSRGKTIDSRRWGHDSSEWTGLLMPDNIIKTYQGYGVNWDVAAENDPHLAQTGLWMIDEVTFTAAGTIEIRCRDLGRLLLEQGFEAPVLPNDFSPTGFKAWTTDELTREVTVEEKVDKVLRYETSFSDPPVGPSSRIPLLNATSSVYPWRVGTNGDGGPGTVKDPNNYNGRGPRDALDDNGATFWISVGNSSPRAPFAYEWIEADIPNQTVNEVVVQTAKAGYQCYISVMRDGAWLGAQKINYREAGVGRNGSNIAFVAQQGIPDEGRQHIRFPPVERAQKIRITLGNLQDWSSNFGTRFPFRAAIRTIEAYATAGHPGAVHTEFAERTVTQTVRNTQKIILEPGAVGENPQGGSARYGDYTDLVKLFCAWGGFYWPEDAVETLTAVPKPIEEPLGEPLGVDDLGNPVYPFAKPRMRRYTFDRPDTKVLGHVPGRVWGDFMSTGQSGKDEISQDNFMAKSLREGINLVQDTVSFNFWIDELGSVQWRYPNIDSIGNWVTDIAEGAARTQRVWEIDEKQILLDMSTTLSSRRIAEIVVLKDLANNAGYVSSGYNPNPTGLRRSIIWTDAEQLADRTEAEIMGDLIATRMLFNYRANTMTIPGFAGLQIDDQIQVHERTTSDSFYHLITAISSEHNNETGEWTMNLNTMWLGDSLETRWAIPRRVRDKREEAAIDKQPVETKKGFDINDPNFRLGRVKL